VSLSPEKASLDIYTVNAYDQVTQKSSTDITDLFYQRENIFLDFKIDTLGGTLVLTQLSEEQDQSLSNLETHSWIAGFNFDGELLYNIRDFGNDELYYDDIRPFHFQDNILYFFVNYSLPELTGFAIFKYDLALDEAPVKIGSIDQERVGSFDLRSINTPIKLIDDAFLLPIYSTNEYIENAQWRSGFSYYVSINLNDLTTSNSNIVEGFKSDFFAIYPNPATDRVVVEFKDMFTGVLEIYSNLGILIKSEKLAKTESYHLDLETLIAGTYIIKLKTEIGQLVQSKIIFKQ